MIKITNLNKYFFKNTRKENHVLKDINLEFGNAGIVLITGPSGCGKTTLLNTIGLLDTFKGQIQIDNDLFNSYKRRPMDKLRNHKIAYIYQNYSLIADLSVRDNLLIKLNLAGLFDNDENDKLINKALTLVGLKDYEHRLVKFLSGGQKQRVGIARAIIFNPEIILADEPTGNLDYQNSIELMQILKIISKEKLVILVSHEKQLAKSFCERIIELSDGNVISDQTNELVALVKEDHNVYLGDLKKEELKTNDLKIDLYSSDHEVIPEFIFYKIKDTIYIKEKNNLKIKLLTKFDNLNLVDAKKTTDEIVTLNKYYDLDFKTSQTSKKRDTLSGLKTFFGAFKRVFLNRRFFGKVFLLYVFIIGFSTELILASLFSTVLNHDTTTKFSDKTLALVSTNPQASKFTNFDDLKEIRKLSNFKQGFNSANIVNSNTYTEFSIEHYPDIDKLRAETITITGFPDSYKNQELVKGVKPNSNNEVVLSSVIADELIKISAKSFIQYFHNYNDFINTNISINIKENEKDVIKNYKITGIVKINKPYLYFNSDSDVEYIYLNKVNSKTQFYALDDNGENALSNIREYQISTLSSYKEQTKLKFYDLEFNEVPLSNLSLGSNDTLIKKNYRQLYPAVLSKNKFKLMQTTAISNPNFNIKGYFTYDDPEINNAKPSFFMDKEAYLRYLDNINFNTYSKDMFNDNSSIARLNNRNKTFSLVSYLFESSNPESDIKEFANLALSKNYELYRANDLRAKFIFRNNLVIQLLYIGRLFFTFFFVMLALFFVIRSSTITRAKEIMTYRLIGLSTREIKKTFIFETLTYYFMSYIPGVILSMSLVASYNLRSNFVKYFLAFRPYYSVIVHLIILGLFILIGLIPVSRLLRKTPASLQAKYEL